MPKFVLTRLQKVVLGVLAVVGVATLGYGLRAGETTQVVLFLVFLALIVAVVGGWLTRPRS